ncbi:MAG: hypothetical protein WC455_16840 [Dehalococcoidia bacterium]|jgi:hypothetical protein
MKTKIYALRDNHYIRYVGKTIRTLECRLAGHLAGARCGEHNHKAHGIRKMLLNGQIPRITLLEEVEGNGSKEEIAWIKFFRDGGVDLWNQTEGGDGGVLVGEAKVRAIEKMKQSLMGHFVSAVTRKKQSEASKKQVWSKARRRAHGDRCRGRILSEVARKNMSAGQMGHTVSAAARKKSRDSQLGRPHFKARHPYKPYKKRQV